MPLYIYTHMCVCAYVCLRPLNLCSNLCYPMDCSPLGSSVHGDSPGKNIGVGCRALLQVLHNPGMEPESLMFPVLTSLFFTTAPPGKHLYIHTYIFYTHTYSNVSFKTSVSSGIFSPKV